MLCLAVFDDAIAAKIIKTDSNDTFINFCIPIEGEGELKASDKIKNSIVDSKKDFDIFIYENGKHFFWVKKNIHSKSGLLKAKTEGILSEGIESFDDGFVPTSFLKSIGTHRSSETVIPTTGQATEFSPKKDPNKSRRVICGFSKSGSQPIYNASLVILLFFKGNEYTSAAEKKINRIEKAQAEFKNDLLSEFDHMLLDLDSERDDENIDILTQVQKSLSLQRIVAEDYHGHFLSPSACNALTYEDLEKNKEKLRLELGLTSESRYKQAEVQSSSTQRKAISAFNTADTHGKPTNNSVNFVRGAGEQKRTINVCIDRRDTVSEQTLKNEGARQFGGIEWTSRNGSIGFKKDSKAQYHGQCSENSSLDGDSEVVGEMRYFKEDELPFSSSVSTDKPNKLKTRQLRGNIFGFSSSDGKPMSPDPLQMSQTTTGRKVEPTSKSSIRKSDQDKDSKQPSGEKRQKDRERSLRRLGKS